MAGPDYVADDYWPNVAVFDEHEIKSYFNAYDILRFNVHKSSGFTPTGEPHNWHIYSVVARKSNNPFNTALRAGTSASPSPH
jgi:hypothetical protein